MKPLLLLSFVSVFTLNVKSQITIAAARSSAIGTTVTVRGIVTNGKELGIPIRYLQDGTGGLAAYSSSTSVAGFTNVAIGDSISVTGPTKMYSNLLEIDPIQGFTIHASGKPLPNPVVVTPSGFNETVESQLIKIQNCTFSASGNFTTTSANYTVTSSSQTFIVRVVSTATTITGTAIPTGPVDIIGIASQFCSTPTSGCTTGYQLLPRTFNDINNFTGINELTQGALLSVYPNPTSNKINFKLGGNSETIKLVVINDIYGRNVLVSSDNSTSLDVSSLATGLYYLSVTTDKQTYQSKFTTEK